MRTSISAFPRLTPRFAAFVLTLGLASLPLTARAELPPSAYEEMKDSAPEALVITIVDTKLRTAKTPEWERTSVFAKARVDSVARSKSGLKKGQIISIRTVTEKALSPGWVGPSPIPIVEKGKQYQAWLKRGGSAYYAAARGQSFVTPLDQKNEARKRAEKFKLAVLAPSVEEQRSQINQLLLDRNAEANVLASYLDPENPSQAAIAMFLLGQCREVQLMPRIAWLIEMERTDIDPKIIALDTNNQLIESRYPAVPALISMGRDATPEMLRIIATTEKPLSTKLALYVLSHVESVKASQFFLSEAIEKESDVVKKTRLQTALKQLLTSKAGTALVSELECDCAP